MLSQVLAHEPILVACTECQFEDSRLYRSSERVSFRLAMSALSARKSTWGKLSICLSASDPEALMGTALPPQFVTTGVGQALLAFRGQRTGALASQPLAMKNCPTCIPHDPQMSCRPFQLVEKKKSLFLIP